MRVLDAASKLFAEKGFRSTTVAAICKEAKANIAAVNYYFGGKEDLYREAWRHAHDRTLAQVPPDGGIAPDAPAAERLRGRIRAGIQRSMFGDAIAFRIMQKEMANPTELLHEVFHNAIEPLRRDTQAIMRDLLGPRATAKDIELCEMCVISPLLHMRHRRHARRPKGPPSVLTESSVEEIVKHLTEYALAGIRQIRKRTEEPDGSTGRK